MIVSGYFVEHRTNQTDLRRNEFMHDSPDAGSMASPARCRLRFDRILLVHPLGYRADAASSDIARLAGIMPPIGLASLAAWLETKGIEATIIDAYARPDAPDLIRERLLADRPAFMGMSCTTSGFLDAVRLSAVAKAILPGIQTVVGGAHVSALKTSALDGFPDIDFAVVGEGENTLAKLIDGGWEQPAAIPGLVYREKDGAPRYTGPLTDLIELDTLPFPAYDKLPGYPDAYRLPIFNYPRAPNTSCVSSRGCPYACSYCDRSVFGRSFRFNSAEYMLAMVRNLHERFGVRHINFCDDQFTFHRKRVETFARGLAESGLGISFNCAARAEHLDEDLLRTMKAGGCWMISMGVETGDPELLARHRNHADLDRLHDCIAAIKRAGIRVKGLLMMGLPGETTDSIQRSMDYVFRLPIDDISLTKFPPFPGSPVYSGIHEHGDFTEDWERMDCMNFQFIPTGMTREQLEKLHQSFYRKHFLRPRIMWDYTTMIWRSPDSWRRFWTNAGSFLRFARNPRRLAHAAYRDEIG